MNLNKISFSILGFLIVCGMFACSSTKNSTAPMPDITYKRWVLQSINGLAVDSNISKKAYIIFSADGSVGGNTSCNSFGAQYQITKNKMEFSQPYSTKKACVDSKNTEANFLAAFNKVNKFSVDNNVLTLWNNKENMLSFTAP